MTLAARLHHREDKVTRCDSLINQRRFPPTHPSTPLRHTPSPRPPPPLVRPLPSAGSPPPPPFSLSLSSLTLTSQENWSKKLASPTGEHVPRETTLVTNNRLWQIARVPEEQSPGKACCWHLIPLRGVYVHQWWKGGHREGMGGGRKWRRG